MLGAQSSPYLSPGEWQLSFGYRWQKSDRHFTGSEEDEERETEGSQVINDLHLMDFGATYQIGERLSATLSLPVVFAERSTPLRDSTRAIVGRDTQHANGIGDMSLLAGFWLLEPSAHQEGNVGLGLGVKFPTGDTDIRHRVPILRSGVFVTEERTVDQSITPGDGGFGMILDLRAFQLVLERVTLFAQGSYLFNPRNTNGVPTFRTLAGEEVMSVADQYLGRLGFAVPVLPKRGLSFSLAGRIEGVPVRDLIGESDGFRRPGYAVSIEPGLIYAFGKNTIGVSTPVALHRDRLRSLADRRASPDRHGDAAFADYLVLFNYTRRLGGPGAVTAPPPGGAAMP